VFVRDAAAQPPFTDQCNKHPNRIERTTTMMRADHLADGEIAEPQPAPGFLLAPFGWAAEPVAAMIRADRSLFADLFAIDRSRMHLIALAVAHLNLPAPPEIGPLLLRASARQVLNQVLGQLPVGIRRVLSHLPDAVLSRESYQRLVDLLVEPQAAKVLHHTDQIDDTAIRVLADLPQKLRKPLAFAVADWPRKLHGLNDSLQFLVSHGVGSNVDELIAELATVTAGLQLAAMVEFWVGRLPLPETMPPATVGNARRLDQVDTVCSLGRAWRNCLAHYGAAIDAGSSAVYLWEDGKGPAACLVNRHGRLGWLLDQVKGPRNSEVEPKQLALIATAFADVGVPSSQVVHAIESIVYVDSCALRPLDEDC
jgi:hypothetical protein